jgi:hypothetical protein
MLLMVVGLGSVAGIGTTFVLAGVAASALVMVVGLTWSPIERLAVRQERRRMAGDV